MMQIRVGYELVYNSPQPTPMTLTLRIHSSRALDMVVPDTIGITPPLSARAYIDTFGNLCTRIMAPAGEIRLFTDAIINDSGLPDEVNVDAIQHPVQDLPDETFLYLQGSRYCETDLLSQMAWDLFGQTPEGWPRVQAICDFVHNHVVFGYHNASPFRSAWTASIERCGVCRDFTHLAVTFCRCMNIPARYCTGYLGDIRIPPSGAPGDFAAWFEAYLGGRWYTFDPRNNRRYIGRILIARGRDAADVPISHSFGPNTLTRFKVWTDEVIEEEQYQIRA